MADSVESILQDEIEVLQSIYMDEMIINGPEERPDEIIVMLHPYTADEEDKKYVCLQLIITLTKRYPHVKPSFEIKNPRGISDAQLESILVNLNALSSQKCGEAVLFDLIEYAKECLTDNNRPECDCAICMDNFKTDEDFVRTDCYHYFHLICMAQYVKNHLESLKSKDETSNQAENTDYKDLIPCPICRSLIKRELLKIDDINTDSPESEKVDFKPSKRFLRWRERMKEVYARQQKRGGIIDIEAERNKFLIQAKEKIEIKEPPPVVREESLDSTDYPGVTEKIELNTERAKFEGQSRTQRSFRPMYDRNKESKTEGKDNTSGRKESGSYEKGQGYYRTQRNNSQLDGPRREKSEKPRQTKVGATATDRSLPRRMRRPPTKTVYGEDNKKTFSGHFLSSKNRTIEESDSKLVTKGLKENLCFEEAKKLRPPPGFKPI